MSDTKPWWSSIGLWGSLVAILAQLLRLLKIELDPQAQADLVGMLMTLATVAATGLAIYGRIRATKRLTVKIEPPATGSPTP